MSQPVQLVLCVLLLNLRFRRLWLIYSSIRTSHNGAWYDILKTKSDSDEAEKNSVCKIISEPFQRPQRCFFFIYCWHKRFRSVLPSVFCFIFLFMWFWNVFSCFPVSCVVESILVTVCYLCLNVCFLFYFEGSLSCILGVGLSCTFLLYFLSCCTFDSCLTLCCHKN